MYDHLTDKKAIAEYARDLIAELAAMARGSNLPTLAYLLDLSRAEAECILEAPPGIDDKRLPRREFN